MIQPLTEVNAALQAALSAVAATLTAKTAAITALASAVAQIAGQLTGILSTVTTTLSYVSALITEVFLAISASVTTGTTHTMNPIFENGTQLCTTIIGALIQIGNVLGPNTAKVQASFNAMLTLGTNWLNDRFTLVTTGGSADQSATATTNFTGAMSAALSGTLDFLNSVQDVVAPAVATISTVPQSVIEAVDALAVLVATGLQFALTSVLKAAHFFGAGNEGVKHIFKLVTDSIAASITYLTGMIVRITTGLLPAAVNGTLISGALSFLHLLDHIIVKTRELLSFVEKIRFF